MAKPNYSFEKRQRELAKQKKKADKEAEKAARKRAAQAGESGAAGDGDETVDNAEPGDEAPTG